MEIKLSAQARIKALGIVNNWPSPSHGWIKLVARLSAALELTDTDRAACNWQQVEGPTGQALYSYNGGIILTCELSAEDARALRNMVEPSERATYTSFETKLLAEFEAALGELL